MNISNNANIDQGIKHAGDISNTKFEESFEKFFSVCDQMELHLKTAIDHSLQNVASQHHTPSQINPSAGDNQKYAHYISTIKSQVSYVKEIHSELVNSTANVSNISSRTSADQIASMETSS
ncbi:Mediator of RNA polymerase II transcription subunit 29 [Armadillidium nasatum]|uniref:Mediator of RNA polymerase II transcription subunit 29 n=1 Tax=Armadillidium nasatum TaxID=96803 RepID=A0A5N5TFS7_9CRUS|nr:Mediator of RNA polymerase II transcription subunit 29 [Armadillidium nasatum]